MADLENADYIRETLNLADCRIALRVDRELRSEATDEVVLHDVRYFVCSLDPAKVTAADLLQYVRQHWRIENSLHLIKDRWWDEDRHHTWRPGLSACMAAINNAALSIHRLKSDPNIPVRAAADYIAWDPNIGLTLLDS
jgi:predicted transposase YbfD/YdcC